MRFTHPAALAAAVVITLAGCAAVQKQEAVDAEQLLAAAGFRAVPTDTPTLAQDMKDLRPRQLFARTRDGSTLYVFSDPYNCRCFYVGEGKAYAELQRLRTARIAEHDRLLAQDSSDRSLNADLWGPWNPEGLVAQGI